MYIILIIRFAFVADVIDARTTIIQPAGWSTMEPLGQMPRAYIRRSVYKPVTLLYNYFLPWKRQIYS